MKIGYARISTAEQNLDSQMDELRAAGAERIFHDTATGANCKRPGFEDLCEHVRGGDTVVVCRLDRLARSLKDLLDTAEQFAAKDVQLRLLHESIDTSTPTGRLTFQLFGAIAEFERHLIIERTTAGLAAARARGKTGGRKPVLDDEKKTAIDLQFAAAAKESATPNYKAIGRSVNVSERTIRRYAATAA